MSDRASPAARAVVTPAAAQQLGTSTLHESTSAPPPRRESAPQSSPSLSVPLRRDARDSAVQGRPPSGDLGQPTNARSSGPIAVPCCPNCKAPTLPGMQFCRECGALIQPGLDSAQTQPEPLATSSSCWRCHAVRDVGAAFCRFCGASFVDSSTRARGRASEEAPGEARLTPVQNMPQVESPHLPTTAARLVTLLKDGSEGRSVPLLGEGDTDVGSSEGGVTFPDDPYMSPRHARIAFRAGSYTLLDLDSVNGVYVRLRDEVELRDRDTLLIGQQVLRFELMGDGELSLGPAWQRGVLVFGTPEAARFARLVQYTTEGVARDVHYLFRDETTIGRENGDIVFTDDPFLSRRHAAVRVDHARRRYTLQDLGSSNGTALRIRGEHVLRDGDQFRIGRHLFRYEAGPAGGRAGR